MDGSTFFQSQRAASWSNSSWRRVRARACGAAKRPPLKRRIFPSKPNSPPRSIVIQSAWTSAGKVSGRGIQRS